MADWEFPDVVEEGLAKQEPRIPKGREDRINQLEEEVHQEAAEVMAGALKFAEIDPRVEGPPEEWVTALGRDRAEKRWRMARAAWMPAKDAPMGLKLAKDVLVGISKARSQRNQGVKSLHLTVVNMTANIPQFEELEVAK